MRRGNLSEFGAVAVAADMNLAEIAFAAGFGSVRRFNDAFAATYKRAPSSFRRRR